MLRRFKRTESPTRSWVRTIRRINYRTTDLHSPTALAVGLNFSSASLTRSRPDLLNGTTGQPELLLGYAAADGAEYRGVLEPRKHLMSRLSLLCGGWLLRMNRL